ncbi:MAG: AMP-binding protein [Deltaproteobacteria bacterium]|nr:AMP-binding protein [Deltaproteobacteria bacterium]
MVLSGMLDAVRGKARARLLRAVTVGRVALQTGLARELRSAGALTLLGAVGQANQSLVFRFHAANQPLRTALVHGARRLSYLEADEHMDRVAAALGARGIGAGDVVALMLGNVPEFLFTQIGAGRLGAAVVNASWRSTPAELEHLLGNSGARALFVGAGVAQVVSRLPGAVRAALGERVFTVGGEVAGLATYEQLVAGAGVPSSSRRWLRGRSRLAEQAAVVVYTSGTTGKPKGAVRRFGRDALTPIFGFIGETPMRAGGVHVAVCPLYHSTAFAFVGLTHLLGGQVVLLDRFEPEGLLDALQRHGAHHTALVPTMLHRLVELGEPAVRARDLSALQAIFVGGAPLRPALCEQAMRLFGDRLYNFYGATETGLVTLAGPADLRAAPGTIGRCVVGNEIRLLAESGRECAPGEVAELYVRSSNLVAGYHRDDRATQEAMRAGFFSVGDLGRRDERGYYFLTGRKRDMIISGGVNVYPVEIEDVLCAHPAVAEAAVVGVPDEEWGERVRAFVVRKPGAACEAQELIEHCRGRLAGPKVPREVVFVASLPRTATGKVEKNKLRELGPQREVAGGRG